MGCLLLVGSFKWCGASRTVRVCVKLASPDIQALTYAHVSCKVGWEDGC